MPVGHSGKQTPTALPCADNPVVFPSPLRVLQLWQMDVYGQRMQALDTAAAEALAAAAAAAPLQAAVKGVGGPPADSALSLNGENDAASAESRRLSQAEEEALTEEFERHVSVI